MKFKEFSFRELLSHIVDNRGKTCPAVETGMPLIATNCIKNSGLYPVYEKLRYVSEETYRDWFRGHPEPGDMIFVCKGSPGRVCWVPDPVPFCIAQDMVAIRADETKVYPKYLFALLRSEATQKQILNMHVGTLIPHFKKGDFANLYLQIPDDYEYQRLVGDAYFSFCEKSESNHQINQTLEQMAQAIFKSWFVDFEPVRAKIAARKHWLAMQPANESASPVCYASDGEHRPPGDESPAVDLETAMNLAAMGAISGKSEAALARLQAEQPKQYAELQATAALFPAAMQESELGEIPEGWEVLPLSDMVDLIGGGTPKKSEPSYWGGDICWFSVKDAPGEGNVFVIDTEDKITDAGVKGSSTKLLPLGTTIITARGTVGKLALTGVVTAMNQSCYGVVGSEGTGPYLNYLRLNRAVETLKRNTHGAVFDTITRKTFETVVQAQACLELRQGFEKIVGPVFEAIKANLHQIKTLSELRDSLLPRLLAGELTLPEAEPQLQEVAHV